MTPPGLATAAHEPTEFFAMLRDRDVLVHHPYDSFATSVEAFITQAAEDPAVLGIKQTLYRTSGDSPIVASLIRAAENGKQVAAIVELKARFDEEANIGWARALEEAGVHVVYGIVGLKTHSKTALVLRREEDGVRHYCHVGTGNYNSKTARIYEDLGLLTAAEDIGADVGELFNYLTGFSRHADYRQILVSPVTVRKRIMEMIEEQADAGPQGRIVFKLNGLTDAAMIDALYRASGAGVPIDLAIRGLCRLRPGIPELSETIRVRSIVGSFLEHSRIYRFGGAPVDPADGPGLPLKLYIGSADLMGRNLDRRVEVLVPVRDPELQARLFEVLDLVLDRRDQLVGARLGPALAPGGERARAECPGPPEGVGHRPGPPEAGKRPAGGRGGPRGIRVLGPCRSKRPDGLIPVRSSGTSTEWVASRLGSPPKNCSGPSSRPTPRRLLDLGCGDGRLAALALDARPSLDHVLALDRSAPMLDSARARFDGDPRVTVRALGHGRLHCVVRGFRRHRVGPGHPPFGGRAQTEPVDRNSPRAPSGRALRQLGSGDVGHTRTPR